MRELKSFILTVVLIMEFSENQKHAFFVSEEFIKCLNELKEWQ